MSLNYGEQEMLQGSKTSLDEYFRKKGLNEETIRAMTQLEEDSLAGKIDDETLYVRFNAIVDAIPASPVEMPFVHEHLLDAVLRRIRTDSAAAGNGAFHACFEAHFADMPPAVKVVDCYFDLRVDLENDHVISEREMESGTLTFEWAPGTSNGFKTYALEFGEHAPPPHQDLRKSEFWTLAEAFAALKTVPKEERKYVLLSAYMILFVDAPGFAASIPIRVDLLRCFCGGEGDNEKNARVLNAHWLKKYL